MISKRVGIAPKNDNYARLAKYIADAGRKGEKSLLCWCAGCAEKDYAEAVAEVAETQALNTRTAKAKTYHLIASFRPEDKGGLTPELLRHIEERFAATLDLSEHQRHCAVHKNTGNVHLHVAYNLIHPERLTMREPFRDYRARDRLCRELEREYGLHIDNGREQRKQEQSPLGEKAAVLEAYSGEESFESYAIRQKPLLMEALERASNWREFHEALAVLGLAMQPHGNGLAIRDRHGKYTVKASAVDRSLSMKKLEVRFGSYIPAQDLDHVQEQSRYQSVPLHRSPERGGLYAEYRQGIEVRKTRLQIVKEREDAALAAIRTQWAAKRKGIERMGMAKKNRRSLLALARRHEAEAMAGARLSLQSEREAVRRDVPFTSWNGFLQRKAEQGSETALAILRSGQEEAGIEKEAEEKDWSRHGGDQFAVASVEYAVRERAALETDGISGRAKTRLLAVLRMEWLAEEERHEGIAGFSHRVDRKGAVVFTLLGGGVIRDQGRELFFSEQDAAARQAAMAYARKKWGRGVILEGNCIIREQKRERELEKEKEQRRGMER
jgi:hypothetical protein